LIYRYALTNGVRVVVEPVSHAHSVSMGVWIRTGSRDERAHESGMSHFLEHMFFKGTQTRTARELAEAFDCIGGQVNAFTAKEYTCFHVRVLAEHAENAMRTLCDMMLESIFDPDELDRERRVVIEEIKMYEDDPEETVHDSIVECAFPGHPVGANILGTEKTLSSFTRGDLLDFVERRYAPEDWVLSFAGRLDPDALMSTVEQLFGGFRRAGSVRLDTVPVFALSERFIVKPIEQVHVCLGYPGFPSRDSTSHALHVLNHIVGASSSSRLFQSVREERGLAYHVFSYHEDFRDAGLFAVYFGSSPDQAQTVLDVVLDTLAETVTQGVGEDELQKAKNQVRSSLLLGQESTFSRMSRIAKQELLLDSQESLEETLAAVEAVSRADVERLAARLWTGPCTLCAIGPAGVQLKLPEAARA
jgi:predicted Zn-dependent peptidase